MPWWRRSGRSEPREGSRAALRQEAAQVREHLWAFAGSRRGVEAYVEPATNVTPPTVVLVATDGEWTRRRVPDPALVRALAAELAVPVYDVNLTGYPQRMRDWTAAQTARSRAEGESRAEGKR